MLLNNKGKLMSDKMSKKGKISVGLDIGCSSIKLVKLFQEKNSAKFQLTDFAFCMLADDTPEAVKKSISELLKETKISSGTEVVANIPNNSAINRYVLMPKMSNEELRKAVGFELEKYIAFDVKDAIYDFNVLDDGLTKEGHLKILLVITKKETVSERAKIIEEAGLTPKVITIDSVVVKNTFYLSYPDKKDKNVAIVDLGSKLCSITVVKNSASNFMRDIPIGTDNIVTLAKEKLSMDKKQVLDLIEKPEMQSKEFKDIANSILANLLNELYLSFDYYETQFESGIEEIFVTGGFSRFAGINEFLSKNWGIPTSTFDALKNISVSPDLQQKVRPFADVLAVSIGLALEDTS